LSYLRLTRAEYNVIRRVCLRHHLDRVSSAAFQTELVAGLVTRWPGLAERVAILRRSEIELIYEHFKARSETIPEQEPSGFSSGEWIAFAEACVSYPLPVRFVRPFRYMLVDLFREASPELARKLEALSPSQFEHLYEQATEGKKGPA
jgi:hypothetical protein